LYYDQEVNGIHLVDNAVDDFSISLALWGCSCKENS